MPGDEEPPPSEVLTALVASLRRELAEAVAALGQARSELAQARERIAELETRLKQNPRFSELGLHPGLRRVRLVLAASVSDGVDDEVEVGLVALAATLSAHGLAAFGVHVLASLGGDDVGWR